jgi:hypothetical protein
MPATTSNSSNKYFPGEIENRNRLAWQQAQAKRDRNAAFDTLNTFVRSKGGWIVSLPGDPLVVMETLPDSSLPSLLHERGYDVQPADPATGERIVANDTIEDVTTESTRPAFRTTHAGIRRVLRYCFSL